MIVDASPQVAWVASVPATIVDALQHIRIVIGSSSRNATSSDHALLSRTTFSKDAQDFTSCRAASLRVLRIFFVAAQFPVDILFAREVT